MEIVSSIGSIAFVILRALRGDRSEASPANARKIPGCCVFEDLFYVEIIDRNGEGLPEGEKER
jgi:hypothetical protein